MGHRSGTTSSARMVAVLTAHPTDSATRQPPRHQVGAAMADRPLAPSNSNTLRTPQHRRIRRKRAARSRGPFSRLMQIRLDSKTRQPQARPAQAGRAECLRPAPYSTRRRSIRSRTSSGEAFPLPRQRTRFATLSEHRSSHSERRRTRRTSVHARTSHACGHSGVRHLEGDHPQGGDREDTRLRRHSWGETDGHACRFGSHALRSCSGGVLAYVYNGHTWSTRSDLRSSSRVHARMHAENRLFVHSRAIKADSDRGREKRRTPKP